MEETVARGMMEEENGTINPRLITGSRKEGNEQSERILDNNLKQMNIVEERLDLAGKIGRFWGCEYGLDNQVAVKRSDTID